MSALRLPALANRLLEKQQVVCWFSSQQLLLTWDNKKQQLPLTSEAGFAAGQISDEQQAVTTLTEVLAKEGLHSNKPLAQYTATVFVSSASSPLERAIIKRVFHKAGFNKVSLIAYATALRAFAERQQLHTGVGFYFGYDISEGLVFADDQQAVFSLDYNLSDVQVSLQQLLRETQQLEISTATAQKIYASLAKPAQQANQAVRGRNIQTQQVETRMLTAKDLEKINHFFHTKLRQELQLLTSAALYQATSPEHWLVVGDGFLGNFVQQEYQAKTMLLKSEVELIQGVRWF